MILKLNNAKTNKAVLVNFDGVKYVRNCRVIGGFEEHGLVFFNSPNVDCIETEETLEEIELMLAGKPGKSKLTVRINTHGNEMPQKHGDWIDLSLAEDVSMKAGDFKVLSLGVSMELPEGYYAKLLPRSSTAKKWGILQANNMGIIDHSFSGDGDVWGFPAYAFRDTEIPKGTRIAQFCVVKQEAEIELVQVESLGNPDRGGLGSTGD